MLVDDPRSIPTCDTPHHFLPAAGSDPKRDILDRKREILTEKGHFRVLVIVYCFTTRVYEIATLIDTFLNIMDGRTCR